MRLRISTFFRRAHNIPNEIMLEVTDRCNLDCTFCFNKLYIKRGRHKRELDTSSIKQIIDKIKISGVRIVRFTGGEPLLRDDIFELMAYAYRKKLKVWLNTNATLITRHNVGNIVKYVDNVLVPLNAYNSKDEEEITGKDSFRSKIRGILLLKKNGIKYLRCGTVATKKNIYNLEKFHHLVKEIEFSNWELFRVIPLPNQPAPLNNEDIKNLIEKLIEINHNSGSNYKIANAIPFCSYDPEKVGRVAWGAIFDDGHSRFVINSAGVARPMYYIDEDIGNIFNDSVSQIWNNDFMRKMRRLEYVPSLCRKCKFVNVCKGGSRIVSKVMSGSYEDLDYLANLEFIK